MVNHHRVVGRRKVGQFLAQKHETRGSEGRGSKGGIFQPGKLTFELERPAPREEETGPSLNCVPGMVLVLTISVNTSVIRARTYSTAPLLPPPVNRTSRQSLFKDSEHLTGIRKR